MTAATKPKVQLNAGDLRLAIEQRYEYPEWRVEPEVTLAGRRLDVVAFNLWGARAYRVVGFEIKVSRGDWLRELDAFQKSEEWMRVVDSFYIVTPPKLVQPDELPEGWGLLELVGSRMMTRRHAATATGRTALPREVAARFFTRILDRQRELRHVAEDNAKLRTDAMKARGAIRAEVEAQVADQHAKQIEELQAKANDLRYLLTEMGFEERDHRWSREAAMQLARHLKPIIRSSGSFTFTRRLRANLDEIAATATAARAAADALDHLLTADRASLSQPEEGT